MGESLTSFGDIDHRRLDALKLADPSIIPRTGAVLQQQFDRAQALLHEHRAAIKHLANRLVEQKVLSGEEIQKVVSDLGGQHTKEPA